MFYYCLPTRPCRLPYYILIALHILKRFGNIIWSGEFCPQRFRWPLAFHAIPERPLEGWRAWRQSFANMESLTAKTRLDVSLFISCLLSFLLSSLIMGPQYLRNESFKVTMIKSQLKYQSVGKKIHCQIYPSVFQSLFLIASMCNYLILLNVYFY